jgi:hypothetical protein
MNCLFCHQPTSSPIKEGDQECRLCRAYFMYSPDGQPHTYYFNYKNFRIWFYVDGMWPSSLNMKEKFCFYLTKKALDNSDHYKDILYLKQIPNITPQNIEKKLPILLLFM